jgi:hypothetical protein
MNKKETQLSTRVVMTLNSELDINKTIKELFPLLSVVGNIDYLHFLK